MARQNFRAGPARLRDDGFHYHHDLIALFLKGFKEAIGLAVVLVVVYLALNVVVVLVGIYEALTHAEKIPAWRDALFAMPNVRGNPLLMVGVALFLFPKLALGLSGFETGVAVMPLVKGEPGDDAKSPTGRIRNTRKLLLTAALIMSVMLIASSVVTTLLIPAHELAERTDTTPRGLRTSAPSPTWRTSTWATPSERPTT
jgi:hypothetical protein